MDSGVRCGKPFMMKKLYRRILISKKSIELQNIFPRILSFKYAFYNGYLYPFEREFLEKSLFFNLPIEILVCNFFVLNGFSHVTFQGYHYFTFLVELDFVIRMYCVFLVFSCPSIFGLNLDLLHNGCYISG